MDEEWRPVVGFADYAVSSEGRIKRAVPDGYGRMAGRIMRQTTTKAGYLLCGLSRGKERRTVSPHRLVCEAFHGPAPSPLHQAAHCDGNRSNNRADNLRWVTPSENEADKHAHGTARVGAKHHASMKPECVARGSRVGTSKLTESDVALIRADGRSRLEICATYGITKSHVSDIRSRKLWRHVP